MVSYKALNTFGELNEEKLIDRIGLKWILTDNNRSV